MKNAVYTRSETTRRYYPALDGLRGIAILLVVFYHNFGFINYFLFGWLGVDLFFVLSGFLITDILLRTKNEKNYLKNFYLRRLLRIAPLYYLSLILFLFIVPTISNLVDFSYYYDHQWWFWLYLQNWLLISGESSDNTTALHHFWSLAVEEQFYLLWPWLILLIKKPKNLIVIILVLLFAVISIRTFIWMNQIQGFNYFGFYTFTRVDGLCIGSLLAVLLFINAKFLQSYSTIIIFGLAVINFIFYFINYNTNYPYLAIIGYTTLAVIFSLLIYEAISLNNKTLNFFLRLNPLVFLGKISYGLYIFHWPIFVLFSPQLDKMLINAFDFPNDFSRVITAIILSGVAIVVSVISFHFFEKHFLKLKDTSARS